MTSLIPSERIEQSILLIRGHKVMLDADLAELYGVPTKVLNQAVKRNKNRFPPDFMFQLTEAEKDEVVTVCDHLRRLRFSPSLPKIESHDEHIQSLFDAIRQLMTPPEPKKRKIGFLVKERAARYRRLGSSREFRVERRKEGKDESL